MPSVLRHFRTRSDRASVQVATKYRPNTGYRGPVCRVKPIWVTIASCAIKSVKRDTNAKTHASSLTRLTSLSVGHTAKVGYTRTNERNVDGIKLAPAKLNRTQGSTMVEP